MKVDSQELAISQDAFSEHASVYYDDHRASLDNSLGGLALAEILESEDAIANRELLKGLVDTLPAVYSGAEFRLNNQADVRWIQNSVLWVSRDGNPATHPYYVIGEEQRGKKTNLLLHAPRIKRWSDAPITYPSGNLFVGEMRKREFGKMTEGAKNTRHKALPIAEINQMMDCETKQYVVTAKESMLRTVNWAAPDPTILLGKMARFLTDEPGIKERENFSAAIAGQDFTRFHIFDHLNHLGKAFNTLAVMRYVTDQHVVAHGGEQSTSID